ncbi:MAG: NAD(P)-dependent oxidoreductase [Alphaproteobacteria bacterium]|jgi:nucleoside-diphosphate-sugar epimerase|nr:NAD(P)-dependent oxidoreductase [Alphaproteobacteria bacterium]
MALLITGAMGHVGLELTAQAVAAGHKIVAQYRSTFRETEAAALGDRVAWVRCDLADPFEVADLAGRHDVDGCIHTAAVPNDRYARPDPRAAFHSNVTATENLLELARRNAWRRFLYVSTGSVFQRLTDFRTPVPEDAGTSAYTVYGATKRCGELLTTMHREEYGMPAASVRISWVYGPPMVPPVREPPRGPIPAFLREALAGEPIAEASGGDFAASFTHVGDVATGLLAAYDADRLNHDIYHLGSGRNYDTFRVAEAVRAAVPGAAIEVGPGTEPWTTYNTMRGPLAGTRLLDDAGFRPAYDLEAGIQAFADWMRAHPETYGQG